MTKSKPATKPLRVMFYVQHLLGIGHLARASRIGAALAADGAEVTVVTGGADVPGFPGPDVRHIALPPVASGDAGFSGLVDANGAPIDDAFRKRRAALLMQAFHDCAPDAVMIEAFPFGRRKVKFELIPLLQAIHAMPNRPRVVASLRDILQERGRPDRDRETVETVQQYFDRVFVHGDPDFVRLEDTFPFAADIADKVVYTGLVAPNAPAPTPDRFDIVVSAGGGAVGTGPVRAALGAAALLPASGSWLVISGPNLPQAEFDAFAAQAPAHVTLTRFRKDFASLLGSARLSVSQAGYNTVCDILRAGCASVLLPFTAGGETEQIARATRLRDMGRVELITEADLTPHTLAAAITKALSAPPPPANLLDLDGAAKTARLIAELVRGAGLAQQP